MDLMPLTATPLTVMPLTAMLPTTPVMDTVTTTPIPTSLLPVLRILTPAMPLTPAMRLTPAKSLTPSLPGTGTLPTVTAMLDTPPPPATSTAVLKAMEPKERCLVVMLPPTPTLPTTLHMRTDLFLNFYFYGINFY